MRVFPRRSSTRTRGFTLVELGVVVAIIGLMTYTVSASFDSLVPGERLNTSVRKLSTVIREARSEAFARNAEFLLEYDLDEHRFRLITPFVAGGGLFLPGIHREEDRFMGVWHPLRQGVEFGSIVLAGEVYDSGSVIVNFDSSGSASDHWVLLTQPQYNNLFTVEVLALTGLIRLHDGAYERPLPDDSDFN